MAVFIAFDGSYVDIRRFIRVRFSGRYGVIGSASSLASTRAAARSTKAWKEFVVM
jgi:hypothetical protein